MPRPEGRGRRTHPASLTFTIEEIDPNRTEIVLNDLVCVIAVGLAAAKDRHCHALNSGPIHPLQQVPVVLPIPQPNSVSVDRCDVSTSRYTVAR